MNRKIRFAAILLAAATATAFGANSFKNTQNLIFGLHWSLPNQRYTA